MAIKTLIAGALILLLSLWLMIPPQSKRPKNTALLFTNPYLMRALSGPMHTFEADFLWLLSNNVGELAHHTNSHEFIQAMENVIIMDPYFLAPSTYASTYLASIEHNITSANKLLQTARYWNHVSFELYFLEILNLITYIEPHKIPKEHLRMLVKQAYTLPNANTYIGAISVKDWLADVLMYAQDSNYRTQQAIDDLRWLYHNTHDAKLKAYIVEELKKMHVLL